MAKMQQLIKYFFFVLILWLLSASAQAQEKSVELTETALGCLKCHSQKEYTDQNKETGSSVKKPLDPLYRIDSLQFSHSVHGGFSCDDCHSPDYAAHPHKAELKEEYLNTCQDCHAGDKTYAHLQFDEIDVQAQNSIHASKMGDAFKCEMCHNPHTTKLVANSGKFALHELVGYSNDLCLSCHNNESRYHQFTDSVKPDLHETHEWLPNQALHFKHVRCIECHTPKNDTLKVAHLIVPKEEALKSCVECHSENSLLDAKLFKYFSKENEKNDSIISNTKNQLYIIGTHRNLFLTKVSLLIFGLALSGILLHILSRTIKRRRNG